jgi:hypothetical protein
LAQSTLKEDIKNGKLIPPQVKYNIKTTTKLEKQLALKKASLGKTKTTDPNMNRINT